VTSSFAQAEDALRKAFGAAPEARLFVPGRLEILGKHTDYAGGRSLTCAAERGFAVVWTPRSEARLRIVDAADDRRAEIPVDGSHDPALGHWSNYPATVVRRLARNFGALGTGADLAFHSTLPRAAGLSTSSALVTATFMVIADANDLRTRDDFRAAIPDDAALAGYLGCIENGRAFGALPGDAGVGTSGGSEDHTAIVLSLAGAWSCYRYHPVERLRAIALPETLTLVVATSGVAAAKTGGARDRYNRAADLVAELVALATARWPELQFGQSTTLADVLDSSPDAVDRLRAAAASRTSSRFAAGDLLRRLDHFLEEDRRLLPAALDALDAGDWNRFGTLVDRSQLAAETLLGNQVPETIMLQRLARELGAIASSAFGAGFGGSVWALVDAEGAAELADRWLADYGERHPHATARATSFVTRPAPGVCQPRTRDLKAHRDLIGGRPPA
jgi:galactokinase